jgi:spore coat protein JB
MAERNDREERAEAPKGKRPESSDRNDHQTYCTDLEELQVVDFALVELTLYLDTHPMDMQAVQQFNQLVQRRQQLAAAFEMKHGPLLQFGHSYSRFPWQWVETPWPWQI